MNVELTVEAGRGTEDLAIEEFLQTFNRCRHPVQSQMAARFYEIVMSNFGDFGYDRPFAWPRLSREYAKKVRRSHATLFVTGALMNEVRLDTTDPSAGHVSVNDANVPYTMAHQFGNARGGLPARPYFPVDQMGNVTPLTYAEMVETAERELERLLE